MTFFKDLSQPTNERHKPLFKRYLSTETSSINYFFRFMRVLYVLYYGD